MKLVNATLEPIVSRFDNFFSPFPVFEGNLSNRTNSVVIRKLVTSLHAKLFDSCTTVLSPGQVTQFVYLIDRGAVNVVDPTGLFCIVKLTEGSWFADDQALKAVASQFEIVTADISDSSSNAGQDHRHTKAG